MLTWTATIWLEDIGTENHLEIGLNRLTSLYRDKPRISGELESFLTQVQKLEDVTLEVILGIWPLTAVGNQLDILGEIVGQPRGELTDDQYRVFILGRVFINKSKGKTPEVYELLRILGIEAPILLSEYYPCAQEIEIYDTDLGEQIAALVFDWKPGGVSMTFKYSEVDSDHVFRFSSDYTEEATLTNGFPDYDGNGGGVFMTPIKR
jgi:hypothetical protein